MRLKDKVALITGGSSGIGFATAERFIAEGARVVITGRDRSRLDASAAKLGPKAVAVQADVTDPAASILAVQATLTHFGKLDIVFANAGIAGPTPLGATTLEAFESILRTNVTATFFTVQAALPHLSSGAAIVLNGSVHAVLGAPGFSAYAASKAGVSGMTRVLAGELASRGIRVNAVVPGAVLTPIWDPLAPNPQALAGLQATMAKRIPLGQMGLPEQIASAVLFLASDEAGNVHGAELVVDGGHTGSPSGAPVYRA